MVATTKMEHTITSVNPDTKHLHLGNMMQESRTLEMNNVRDGTWHGRGDKICIGGFSQKSKGFFELNPPSIVSVNDESSLETKTNTNVSSPP